MEKKDINLFDLLLHIPNFLGEQECDHLIKYYESRSDSGLYESSGTPEGEYKQSTFKSIELKDPNQFEVTLLKNSVAEIVHRYRDYLKSFHSFHDTALKQTAFNFVHKYRLLKYATGSSIHPHTDHTTFQYGSCTINLNEDYDGGEFTFFRGRNSIKLKRGDAIIFPADFFWIHEVVPITRGTRYSFNCFLKSVPEHIAKTILNVANLIPLDVNDFHFVGGGSKGSQYSHIQYE